MHAPQQLASPHASPAREFMNVKAVGAVYEGRLAPTLLPSEVRVSACTKIGKRKQQEDRCIVVPHIQGRNDVNMFGVFDGTVDNVAVDFVHARLPALLCGSQPFRDALSLLPPSGAPFAACDVSADITNAMAAAVALGFTHTDEELLSVASTLGAHYSACTGVAAVLAGPYLCVAHVGDSKAVLGGRNGDGAWAGMYMTIDHKPDVPAERSRIEASGGCLTYLHGGKPFLRGGDFAERQAKGDRPMQLNYSRAFGGKDLKPYGLTAVPDVTSVMLSPGDRFLIIASDGVWDVVTADVAIARAAAAVADGLDPALELTDYALGQHNVRGSADNVTVIIVEFLREVSGRA